MPDPIEALRKEFGTNPNENSILRYVGLHGIMRAAAEEAREIHRGMVDHSPDDPTCRYLTMTIQNRPLNAGHRARRCGPPGRMVHEPTDTAIHP